MIFIYIYIFLRDLAVCIKICFFYFSMFWRKPGILILDLYLYSIKIQTNIDQNTVKRFGKITDFWNNFFLRNVFFFGLDPASLCGWAGPSQPSLVTGPCQWPAPAAHARVIFYTCMNSIKVIKLPSHCSSSFSQIARMKKKQSVATDDFRCWLPYVFFLFFYILTCIILFAGTENSREHPGFEKVKTMVMVCSLLHCVICLRSVCFFFSFLFSPLCFLTISPLSQFFNTLVSCLPPVFLLTVTSPLSFSFFSFWFLLWLSWLL